MLKYRGAKAIIWRKSLYLHENKHIIFPDRFLLTIWESVFNKIIFCYFYKINNQDIFASRYEKNVLIKRI